MAYHSSMPQMGIFSEIWTRSAAVAWTNSRGHIENQIVWRRKAIGSGSLGGQRVSLSEGEGFVREVREDLGAKAMWREVVGANGSYELREPIASYEADFASKNDGLRQENAFYWDRFL